MKISKDSNPRLRVAMICPYFTESVGGAEISTQLFVDTITQNGIDVTIITNKITSKSKYHQQALPFFNCLSPSWRSFLLNTSLFDYYLSMGLHNLFKKISPEIIHVQDILMLPASIKAAKRLNIPIIATIRDDRFVCNLAVCKAKGNLYFDCSNCQYMSCLKQTSKTTLKLGVFAYLLYIFLRSRSKKLISSLEQCNKIVTVSDYVKSNLIKVGINKDKIQTIYNLIPNWKVDKNEVNRLRDEFGKDRFIIFASGRLEEYKGFHILIKAMNYLIKKKKEALLLIAGEGPYKKELIGLINTWGLFHHVKLIGKINYEKIKNYYGMCDVIVLPSLWGEPLSRVILESIAVNKPVIASNVGGTSELVPSMNLYSQFDYQKLAKLLIDYQKLKLIRKLNQGINKYYQLGN